MVKIMRGATRTAILLWGVYVLKVPRLCSYTQFLHGLLGNLQEKTFSSTKWPELCPVVVAGSSGLWLIMPYARPLTDSEWEVFNYDTFVHHEHYTVPVEHKRDSFGMLYGQVVAVDYG